MKCTIFYSKKESYLERRLHSCITLRKMGMINASIHALRMENMKNVEILLPEKFGLYAIQQTNGSRFFSYILLYLLNTGSLSKIISMVHEKKRQCISK